ITYYCWVDVNAVEGKTHQWRRIITIPSGWETESTVRRDLQLEDAKGVDCLPNAAIFEQLTLMGTMASVMISLATNQKFSFSKYIFESMVKNLDNVNKFLMYQRNIRMVGKGFPRRETPLFSKMMVQAQEKMSEGSTNLTNPHHTPTIIQPSTSQPQKKQKPRKTKRKDTKLPQTSGPITNIADEAVNEEMNDSLVKAATTASCLEAECQEAMEDTIAQNRSENVSKFSNDSLLSRVNTPQSDEDSLKLKELMKLCITLQSRFFDLETTKTTQAMEIESLKRRVKKLEKKQRFTRKEVFVAQEDENIVEKEVDAAQIQVTTAATTHTISIDEVTLA
nr:hypothetical protein [Tanacetum cinerariifolium]